MLLVVGRTGRIDDDVQRNFSVEAHLTVIVLW